MGNQHRGVSINFLPRRRSIAFEQEIPLSQRLFVGLQGGAVFREKLRSEEIQIPAARFTSAGHELEVAIPHPNHQSAAREVICSAAGWLAINQEFPIISRNSVSQFLPIKTAANSKAIGAKPGEFLAAGRARGLQAQQHADGFQNAGFSLCIIARKKRDASAQLAMKRGKTAEIAETERCQGQGREGKNKRPTSNVQPGTSKGKILGSPEFKRAGIRCSDNAEG